MTTTTITQEYITRLLNARTSEDVLTASVSVAREMLSADACHVIAVENGEVDVRASTDTEMAQRNTIPVATDIVSQLDLIGRSHVFDDVCDVRGVAAETTAQPHDTAANPRSLLVVPVESVGLLLATDTTPAAFDDADRRWAEQLTTFIERLVESDRLDLDADTEATRLERIATILSHDFTGPLTVARGSLELAEETGDTAYFERAHKAIDRIEHLVDGIGRMAAADGEFPREELVELRHVVEEVWPSIEHADATLTYDGSRTLLADEHALAQLVMNLLSNAVEYGGPGVTITVGTLDDGFFIEDDGPGIEPALRADAFEWGHTTGDGHKGIGLSIAHQIASAHGWDIIVTEGDAGGARFEVTGVDRS